MLRSALAGGAPGELEAGGWAPWPVQQDGLPEEHSVTQIPLLFLPTKALQPPILFTDP